MKKEKELTLDARFAIIGLNVGKNRQNGAPSSSGKFHEVEVLG